MNRRAPFPIVLGFALLAASERSAAQETPRPEAGKEPAAERRATIPGVSLRVQIVISRNQGDKKLASMPYTMVVASGSGQTRMRMGVDTPVPVATGPSTTSIQYRNVGTNIDCRAVELGEGRYLLSLGIENSSALPFEKGPSSGATAPVVDASPAGGPLFRRFDTNINAVLRDGQSLQTVASTDPVTGEVVKIDVTMNVIR